MGNKPHGRAKVVLPNGCEAHGDFVASKKEGLWLVVSPPDNGNLTMHRPCGRRAGW